MNTQNLLLRSGFVALATALAVPAIAQDATSPQAAETVTGTDNDIIVTATRRASPLSDIPIAVSAVTAQSLQNSGANDIRQLNQLAPSLLVSSTGSEANGSARIRGVGTVGDNPGLESSVAVFIDGVYRSRSGSGLNDLGEIERVEVLRGPQGTLFGRNASAGLLNIVTKGPSFDFGATGEVTYGNYDFWRLSGSLTGPISDKLAARIDGVWSKRDGFYKDVVNGGRINNRDRYLVRGQLLFEPTDTTSFRLIGDWSKKNEACCGAVYINDSVAPLNSPLVSAANNNIIRVLTDLGQNPAAFTENSYNRNAYVSAGRSYDGYTKDGGISLEGNIDLGGAKLTSISGYRYYRNNQPADLDYGQVDILSRDNYDRKFRTFSQELRLQGSAFADKLDWLVGGYYANETLNLHDDLHFASQYGRFAACRIVTGSALAQFYSPTGTGCLSATGRAVLTGALAGAGIPSPFGPAGPAIVAGFDRLDGIRNVGNDDRYRQKSENWAIFTHNIVHLTDRLDVTVGVRYTHESKDLRATFANNNTACLTQKANLAPFLANAGLRDIAGALLGLSCQGNSTTELNGTTINQSRSESEWTGTAVVSWKPVDSTLFYASYSRGYKAGGFNLDRSALSASTIFPLSNPASGYSPARLQFEPEKVNAFEIGAKYTSRHFSLNVAAFRQDFRNFQLNTFNGTVFLVQNINGCSDSLNGGDRDQSKFTSAANYNANASATGACAADSVSYGVRSEGVEIEASFRPARYLQASMGLTYARTKYRDNLVGSSSGAPLDQALRKLPGNFVSNAPEYVTTGSIAWTPPIGTGGLSGLIYIDGRMTGDYNTGSDLFPQKAQDGFTVVNARIGLRGRDERWAIEFWGQNIFNTQYTQVAFNSPFQEGASTAPFIDPNYPGGRQIFSAYLAEPRTYGLTLRGKF